MIPAKRRVPTAAREVPEYELVLLRRGTQVPRGTFRLAAMFSTIRSQCGSARGGQTHARLDEARENKEGSSEREISLISTFS
jgi:hypothetical protein